MVETTDLYEFVPLTTVLSDSEEEIAKRLDRDGLVSLRKVLGFNKKEINTICRGLDEATNGVQEKACEVFKRWKDKKRTVEASQLKSHLANALLSDEVSRQDLADMLLQ